MKKTLLTGAFCLLFFFSANMLFAQSETSFVTSGSVGFTNMTPVREPSQDIRKARALDLERLNKRVSKQFASWYKGKDIRDEQWSHIPGGVMVTFREKGQQNMISFNDRGKWLYTISYLDEEQLPEKIRVQIKTGFSSYKVFGVESISGPSATVFLAHIQNGNSWKILRFHNENIEVEQDLSKSE